MAYTSLASWYDQVMDHVDYHEWATYLLKLVERYNVSIDSAFELGGGTGRLLEYLQVLDSRANAFGLSDLCPEMLEVSEHGQKVAQDMRQLALKDESCDLLFSLYDSFNYLMTVQDTQAFFEECWRVLKPGGFLIFDSTTQYASQAFFEDMVDYEEFDQGEVVRQAWYDYENELQYNDFIFYHRGVEERDRVVEKEQHVQHIWSNEKVRSMIDSEKWTLHASFHNYTLKAVSENSERIHWVLEKK